MNDDRSSAVSSSCRPRLVVLDEATNAIDEASELLLLRTLREVGSTVVTIGHREGLRQVHDLELILEGGGGGGWRLQPWQPSADP